MANSAGAHGGARIATRGAGRLALAGIVAAQAMAGCAGARLRVPAGGNIEPTRSNAVTGAYAWLVSQQDAGTGLVNSYGPSSDQCLDRQGATYDQAVAGIASCALGRCDMARHILDFAIAARERDGGLANFYHTGNGRVGIEATQHAGPNLWIGLLALQYDEMTGADHYRSLALAIARDASRLEHHRGGIVMGPFDVGPTPWTRILSTEHNIDYYALLHALLPRVAEADREWIRDELRAVSGFLRDVAWDPEIGTFVAGMVLPDAVDRLKVLDVITWSIAGIGPDSLSAWGIDPDRLVAFAEAHFATETASADGSAGSVRGFDFTDAVGAGHRARVISLEWTGQMILAWEIMAAYHRRTGTVPRDSSQAALARSYELRARQHRSDLDRLARPALSGRAYPYATQSGVLIAKGLWWTPRADSVGRPVGSVAAATWRIFATGFNPLVPGGWLVDTFDDAAFQAPRPHRPMPDVELEPSTTCTSWGLTDAAWLNLEARRYERALEFGTAVIERYSAEADSQQADLRRRGGQVRWVPGDEDARRRILSFSSLNDVAAAAFVSGKATAQEACIAEESDRRERAASAMLAARTAFALVAKYPDAMVWDPRGFFWSPAEAAMREYPQYTGAATPADILRRGGSVYVYDDDESKANHFVPAIAATRGVLSFESVTASCHDGASCMIIRYAPRTAADTAAIEWQQPENNWGGSCDGVDLTGALRLTFWARGEKGGERVEFVVGGILGRYPDSIWRERADPTRTLTRGWTRHSIDLAGDDLHRVIRGLRVAFPPGSNPGGATIYLDRIRFEGHGSAER